jgi:TolA-binding protein
MFQSLAKSSSSLTLAIIASALALTSAAQGQTVPSEAQPAASPMAATATTPAAPIAVPIPVPMTVQMPVPVPFPPTISPTAVAQAPETLSARTLVRLEQLTRELAETTGRVEALEAASLAQKNENQRLATLLDAARAAAPAPAIVAETSNLPAGPVADDSSRLNSLVTSLASPQAELFVAPTPPQISSAIMLTNAQAALQIGNYSVAEANLAQLIWVYPASPEASEGRWLLGEARNVQSAWGSAAQAYVDYLKVSPSGPRANEALLRLASVFRQLGDNRQRCLALAEFKRRTPRPDATLKARADSEIARMTCPTT